MGSLRIDRAHFLELTAALATVACSPAAATPAEVIVPAPLTTASAASTAEPAEPAPLASVPSASSCDDSRADLSACSRIGPSCEGMVDECRTLASRGDGFQPRVAEKIAKCWADAKMTRPRCRAAPMARCIRDAIETTCIAPGFDDVCEEIFTICRRVNAKPTYTKALCVKMLSSVVGSTRIEAVEALGPSAEGRCTADFALPYYPYSKSMWK